MEKTIQQLIAEMDRIEASAVGEQYAPETTENVHVPLENSTYPEAEKVVKSVAQEIRELGDRLMAIQAQTFKFTNLSERG